MQRLKVGIVGAGTAGLALAAFLAKQGHDVSLFEKFNYAKPLGAGLLLQPTGLSVLSLLGIDRRIIKDGSVIRQLSGKNAGRKWHTLDVRYRDLSPHLFGVGIQRGSLFSALHESAKKEGSRILTSREITEISFEGENAYIHDAEGERAGPFDLAVDCSGARSCLRKKYADIKKCTAYPYGALWSVVDLPDNLFRVDTLDQRYQRAHHMIGVLPVGKAPDEKSLRGAFFWSLPVADYAAWRNAPLTGWKEKIVSLWPETAPLVEQFHSHDDLTLASYSDVVLRSYHHRNLAFIGDAAHCTSPQLGQGANLALMDAYVLSLCVAGADSVASALEKYGNMRRRHVRFYQSASRWLTPFFQSDSRFFSALRFLCCDTPCHVPLTRNIAAQVLCGIKTGPFSRLNPGEWAADYDCAQYRSV